MSRGKLKHKQLFILITITLLVMFSMLPWKAGATTSSNASNGWERQHVNNGIGEVYVEFPTDVYYDPNNLDADTKFPIRFKVIMKDYCRWENNWKYRWVPDYFKVTIYVDDKTDYVSEYYVFDLMLFHPVSTSYNFSLGTLYLHVESPSTSFDWSYEHVNDEWDTLGWLFLEYHQNLWWGDVRSEGCIVVAVHNGEAAERLGHRIHFKLVFELSWQRGYDAWWLPEEHYTCTFIIGDGIPSNSDYYLDLVPNTVSRG